MNLEFFLRLILLTLTVVQGGAALASTCPSVSYRFNTQVQIDALGELGCTSISGDVWIEDTNDVTNLDGLSNVTAIGGALIIRKNAALVNVDGLSRLTSIESLLNISSNAELANLDGFANLTSVGGSFSKTWELSGYLSISDNPMLTTLDGFESLTSVRRGLIIQGNRLSSLSGFNSLTRVGGDLTIQYQPALYDIGGFQNLRELGGLSINDNSRLTVLTGFLSLSDVSGDFDVFDNPDLTHLNGFSSIARIGGGLFIYNNDSLTSLTGLSEILTVGSVRISANDALPSLNGINRLTEVFGFLTVTNNTNLANCGAIASLLGWPDGADKVGSEIGIADNASSGGCNSVDDIFNSYNLSQGLCDTHGSSGRYVQKIFIAYLGRPAAPAGLVYYADFLDSDMEGGKLVLFDDLYYSDEAQVLYDSTTIRQRINQFYQFMFNREALSGGLTYWLNQIAAGFFTVPASAAYIADAASNQDMVVLDAKQLAASKITCAIGDDASKLSAFQANLAGARASLAGIATAEEAEAYDGEAELTNIIGSARTAPNSWLREAPNAREANEDAQPIPSLPMLGFFILSGLLGLFGIRRLAHR